MTLERILSVVLFPAPFGPISPIVSPRRTSKLTSRSAQNSSRGTLAPRTMRRASVAASSRSEKYQPWCNRYFFDTRSKRITTSLIGQITSAKVRSARLNKRYPAVSSTTATPTLTPRDSRSGASRCKITRR